MKTYQIKIGQATRKGKVNKLYEFVINSESDSYLLKEYYKEQYQGFEVTVNEVKEIHIVDVGDEKESKIEVYETSSAYSFGEFKAFIGKDKIENFDNFYSKIEKCENDLELAKDRLKKLVEIAIGYKDIKYFEVKNYGVEFNFEKNKFNLMDREQ